MGTGCGQDGSRKTKTSGGEGISAPLRLFLPSGKCQAFQNRGFVAKSWPGFTAESWEGEEHCFKCFMWSENGIFKVSQAAEAQTFGFLD